MAVSDGAIAHVQELLAGLGPIRIRKMFGAAGVYYDDVIFAVIGEEDLYIKVDEETRSAFEAAGSEPFTFEMKDGKLEAMSYWRLPEAAADDPEDALRWARLGVDAGFRARRPKKATKQASPAADLGPGPWVED